MLVLFCLVCHTADVFECRPLTKWQAKNIAVFGGKNTTCSIATSLTSWVAFRYCNYLQNHVMFFVARYFEREVQTLAPFSLPHTWPIMATSGCGCCSDGFCESYNICLTQPLTKVRYALESDRVLKGQIRDITLKAVCDRMTFHPGQIQ